MAKVQYVSFADILSRINGPPAFNSVSNGAVNVDCPRANIDGSEKALEIINNMIAQLSVYQEEFKRIATKYTCWRTKMGVVVQKPSQPLDAHHHKSQPPHDSPSNTTDQNSVILQTAPKPIILQAAPKPPEVPPPVSAPTSAPMPSVSSHIDIGLIPAPTAVLPNLTNHSSKPAADLNSVVENTIFSPTPKSQPGFTVRSKGATVQSFFGCFILLVERLQHHNIGWVARQANSTMGYALLDLLLFCPFPQVRKRKYEPPPINAKCLGFKPSLEGKAVFTAVQFIHISHNKPKR